eukprot:2931389-Pyramimonas_sp.AAC.1
MAIETLPQEPPAALGKAAGPLFGKLEKKWKDSVKRLQGARISGLEGHTQPLEQRLAHLENELDLAKARPNEAPVASSDWDRVVDHSILVARSPDQVLKAKVVEALRSRSWAMTLGSSSLYPSWARSLRRENRGGGRPRVRSSSPVADGAASPLRSARAHHRSSSQLTGTDKISRQRWRAN